MANLLFTPQLRNRVTYLVNDLRLTLATGINPIDDADWEKVKDTPEIKELLKKGDIVVQPDTDAPEEKLTPVATETKPKPPAK